MKILLKLVTALLFGSILTMLFSCNKIIYPVNTITQKPSQIDSLIPEIYSTETGNSPSGLFHPEKIIEHDNNITSIPIAFKIQDNQVNNEVPVETNRKTSNFPATEIKNDTIYPTEREINEVLFGSILGILLLPLGLTLIISTITLVKSIQIKKELDNNPNLDLNIKKVKAAKTLSIIGVVLGVSLIVFIIIALMNMSLFADGASLLGP